MARDREPAQPRAPRKPRAAKTTGGTPRKTTAKPDAKSAALFAGFDTAEIIAALRAHILGERDMSASQVNAALTVLKHIAAGAADEGRDAQAATAAQDGGGAAGLSHEDALKLLEDMERHDAGD